MPSAKQSAQYWILKAQLVEQGGGDNSAVIDVYEQAVRFSATVMYIPDLLCSLDYMIIIFILSFKNVGLDNVIIWSTNSCTV